jgi:hypothetical protein
MKKLTVLARSNWTDRFYVKFRAEKDSMLVVKAIVETLSMDNFLESDLADEGVNYDDYSEWKDRFLPIISKDLALNIVCGSKAIHVIVIGDDFETINRVFEKFSVWDEKI